MRTFAILFLLFFSFHCAKAQNMAITEIPSLGRLPVNAIHRIFQDSEGYMWYGTVNGLCRDDGYQVEVFRSDIYTPGLLDNNLIEYIAEDQEGKIWFGTNKGAYVLDKKDYSIRPVDEQRFKNLFIHWVSVTSDGTIWISISGYLYAYDASGSMLSEYLVQNGDRKTHISGFCESREGEIIVAYGGGLLYYLDKEENLFKPYPVMDGKGNFGNMIQDKDEAYYWVSTWQNGIVRFDPKAATVDSMYVYQPPALNAKGEVNNVFLYIAQDKELGYIWGTTSQDLVAFSKDAKGMLKQVALPNLLSSSNRMLNEVINDHHGNLWVSAFDQPSFIIHFANDTPTGYSMPALRKRVNGNPAIMALVDSGEGVIWVSQERTGLCLYNQQTDEASCFLDFPNTRQLPLGSIKIMSESRLKSSAWVVPIVSKYAYRLGRRGMEMELLDCIDLSEVITFGVIQSILESQSGRYVWIGTFTGLYRYDLEKGELDKRYDALGFVTDMVETPQGELWVVTSDKGFYRIDHQNELTTYPIVHHFSSVTLTSDNLVWLGSDEGALYSFDSLSGDFRDYSEQCGLKGDMVNQVMADVFNHIWVHTNQKLIEFNPRNQSFRTYQTDDGSMLLWRLIPTSMCKGMDGTIYVGGIPGICSFPPSNRLESAAKPVNPLVTNVKVLGHSLIFGQGRSNCSLAAIELTPQDRNIEITFSSLNHRFAHKIRYAYRLLGVDNEWIYTTSGECTAYYNTLPKGTFTFEVRATDENGLWSNQVARLKVERLPAFYETWWAYTFYFLLLLAAASSIIWGYVRRLNRKNNEMWSDSQEMIKMRRYLDSKVHVAESEYTQLDKLLLDKAVKCVEENLMEPNFDVTVLADGMNMSRSTLTRKLKAITGKTPLEFIRNIKMQHAHHLLANNEASISEVATNLGYFNRKYFTSCFKEEYGMTPSEYQKSIEKDRFEANKGHK